MFHHAPSRHRHLFRGSESNNFVLENIKTKKMNKIFARIAAMAGLALLSVSSYAQNPNFHIYLCFGQSNMEGQGPIESKDKTVDSRFKVMSTVDCSNLGRTKGTWYTAVPPLCRCYTKLSPSDYFGRTMVANLPEIGRAHV